MRSTNFNYDVACLLCSAEVGQVWNGRFRRHVGCTAPMPRTGGMLRCCHCGGSLYLEPTEVYPAMIDQAEVAKIMADEVA